MTLLLFGHGSLFQCGLLFVQHSTFCVFVVVCVTLMMFWLCNALVVLPDFAILGVVVYATLLRLPPPPFNFGVDVWCNSLLILVLFHQ